MKITFLGAAHEVTGSCTLLEIAGKYYDGEENVLVTGESTSQYDLKKTFARDNLVVSIVYLGVCDYGVSSAVFCDETADAVG